MKPGWKKYLLYAGVIIVGGSLLLILIETIRAKNTGFETKTLWDWMELLVIPLVLAIGAFFLEHSEREAERKRAKEQSEQERRRTELQSEFERQRTEENAKLERQSAEDRAKLEREIATDRQQEAALQAYIDRMADLLLKENLRTSENEEVRNIARIRTLSLLRGLDGKRKGIVVRFLYESGLIVEKPVIDLAGADLSGAELINANLRGANLSGTYLNKALLWGINLSAANLSHASLTEAKVFNVDLSEANLSQTFLLKVDLTEANLTQADLTGARLSRGRISDEQLATARSLKGATMPDGTRHA